MTATFKIGVEELSRTFRLEISEKFVKSYESVELPLQNFEGYENYNWQLKIKSSLRHVTLQKFKASVSGLKLSAIIEGSDIRFDIVQPPEDLYYELKPSFTLEQLQKANAIKEGEFTVIVTATLSISYSSQSLSLNFESASKVATKLSLNVGQCFTNAFDFTFNFGEGQSLLVHKACFINWSPVFKAMLEHDTQEARTATLEIKDFDYDTVKAAIDLLYGRPFEPKPISQVVGMLCFVEKYLIKPAVDLLEDWLINHITEDNFDAVVQHAFEHDSKKLKAICAHWYNQLLKPSLRKIDPAIISELVHLAAKESKI